MNGLLHPSDAEREAERAALQAEKAQPEVQHAAAGVPDSTDVLMIDCT